MNRTDRLVAILLELQARGELRAEDLANRFEVSVRTIYRDLDALSEGGVPLVATPGKGYRLLEGYFLPPLHFTADEAAALALGGRFVHERVDPALRRAAEEALRKLVGVLPPDHRAALDRWQRELFFAGSPGAGSLPWLAEARRAIQEQRVARLLYHAYRRPEPELRDVEPVTLVHLDGAWHLAAYCRLRQGPRFFRLDRLDRLQLLPDRFTPAERHAPEHYQASSLAAHPEARVRFAPDVVRWARERQPYIFLREELDAAGPIFVYALRDYRELLRWLLSWGAEVEVLSPPELRARLADEARAVAARNAGPVRTSPPGPLPCEGRGPGGEVFPNPPPAPDTTLSTAPPYASHEAGDPPTSTPRHRSRTVIKGLTYAIVLTDDLPRARAFYTEQLGLGTEMEMDDFSQFTTREGTLWAVMKRPPEAAPKSAKLYLQVDDANAAYRTWQQRGVEMLTEPHDEPFGRTFAFKDPDGRVLHAYAAI